MILKRLPGRKTADRVRKRGKRWRGKHFSITHLRGTPLREASALSEDTTHMYAGTIASSRLDKSAVKRNRMRRRCREALRTTLRACKDLPACQLLIAPRSSSLTCAFDELRHDAEEFWAHVSTYGK